MADSDSILPIVLMTESEAKKAIAEIRRQESTLRQIVLDFAERRGWEAIGYRSLRACFLVEFDKSKSTLFRELAAAQIELELSQGGTIGSIPEKTIRPLKNLPAGERKAAYEEAAETAPDGKPTSKHVEAVVEKHLNPEPKGPQELRGPLPSDGSPQTEPSMEEVWNEIVTFLDDKVGTFRIPQVKRSLAFKIKNYGAALYALLSQPPR